MRIALFSDVHGNAPALRAVLEDAKSKNVEEFWFLGDVLGYGPLPVACLELLTDVKPAIWLMGNHDRGALQLLNEDFSIEDKTVRAMAPGLEERYLLAWHALQLRVGLKSEQVEHLKKLPTWQKRSVENESIYAVHGAILNSDPSADENIGANAYCNAERSAVAGSMLDTILTDINDRPQVIVVGHTHVSTWGQTGWKKPRKWQWTSGKALYNNPNEKWMWTGNGVTILCPGSVGQPRGGQNKEFAYYALLNTEEKNVWFRQVAYHRGEFLAAMTLFLNPDTGQVDSRKIRTIGEYILDANV